MNRELGLQLAHAYEVEQDGAALLALLDLLREHELVCFFHWVGLSQADRVELYINGARHFSGGMRVRHAVQVRGFVLPEAFPVGNPAFFIVPAYCNVVGWGVARNVYLSQWRDGYCAGVCEGFTKE